MSVIDGPWRAVDVSRYELGEGARYLGDGKFCFVDLLSGRLFTTTGTPNSGVDLILDLDEPLGAVAPAGSRWAAAVGQGVAMADSEGRLSWFGKPASGADVALRMNDAVADDAGRLWAGAMSYVGHPGAGFLVRVEPDGSVHRVLEGLTVPNGPAVSPGGGRLYLADTPTGWIRTYDVDRIAGALGPPEDFAHVAEGGPDGMVLDVEGHLWCAIWGASCLHRYSPQGELVERIPVPAVQPTSIALSDRPPYQVVVTSAQHGLHNPRPYDGLTFTAPVSVGGYRTPRFHA